MSRVTIEGETPLLDLSPIADVAAALRDEWATVRFDTSGAAVNPLTGDLETSFALMRGRHRKRGAVYMVTSTRPRIGNVDLPEKEFRELFEEMTEQGVTPGSAEMHRRVEERFGVPESVGYDELRHIVTLRADGRSEVAAEVVGDGESFSGTVVVSSDRLPTIELDGRVDFTGERGPVPMDPWVNRVFGRPMSVKAELTMSAAERGGRLIEVRARSRRYGGRLHIDLLSSLVSWTITGRVTTRCRGLALPLELLIGWVVSKQMRRAQARVWRDDPPEFYSTAQKALGSLVVAIEAEGDAATFVRRFLWDEEYEPFPTHP